MKKYTKTVLCLGLSIAVISSATNANALWGMFEDEKDPLKEELRTPVLNNSAAYVTAPDPNLIYGSMPNNAGQDPFVAPMPNQVAPSIAPDMAQVPLQSEQLAIPAIPEPPQFQPPAPQQFAALNVADSNGYPQLSSIPAMPTPPMPTEMVANPRVEGLKADLQASNQMAAENGYIPITSDVIATNAAPEFMPMPPAIQPPLAEPVAMQQAPMQFASANPEVEPVFPSGPSVTVRSKRSQGFPVSAPAPVFSAPQQVAMPVPQQPASPMFQPAPEVAFAPTPQVVVSSVPPIAPAVAPEKFVYEASVPVASTFDSPSAPIDSNFGVSGTSYTVASNGNVGGYSNGFVSNRHPVMLPQSRYVNYRKTGNK